MKELSPLAKYRLATYLIKNGRLVLKKHGPSVKWEITVKKKRKKRK